MSAESQSPKKRVTGVAQARYIGETMRASAAQVIEICLSQIGSKNRLTKRGSEKKVVKSADNAWDVTLGLKILLHPGS